MKRSCASFRPLDPGSQAFPVRWAAEDFSARLLRREKALPSVAAEIEALKNSGAFDGLADLLKRHAAESPSDEEASSSSADDRDLEGQRPVLPPTLLNRERAVAELIPLLRKELVMSMPDKDSEEEKEEEEDDEDEEEDEDEDEDDEEDDEEEGEEEDEEEDEEEGNTSDEEEDDSSDYVVELPEPSQPTPATQVKDSSLKDIIRRLEGSGELTDVMDSDSPALFEALERMKPKIPRLRS